ncbi:MAG TPA: hypothetical protein DCG16_10165 [Gemmatimonadetes bacterium]|nr:hypothetical protein [Gemmatimonadota bacterium]
MKAIKAIAILFVVYAGLVATFESMLGYFQPGGQGTLVITTTDEGGATNDRVLARLESNGQLYVAANHWPRAWYRQALENPSVQVAVDGESGAYLAVPVTVTDEEHDRVQRDNDTGIVFRVMTGFPPRYFVRLEPR